MNITFLIFVLILIVFTIEKLRKKRKIAFCFLIYDKINNEELWHEFFKNADQNKYSIYVHYKVDKPFKYFEKYKLKKIQCLQNMEI